MLSSTLPRSDDRAALCLPTIFLSLIGVALLLGLLLHAHLELARELAFDQAAAATAVVPPAGTPPINQASIDLALVLYGIEVPVGAEPPVLDLELHDRGLTARGAFMQKAQVTIGPAAFTSWALLGSTLGHEIEIHCHQNFFAIYLLDVLGMDGTGAAERQAYMHELHGAKRFGTDRADTQMIADTVSFYYPDSPTVKLAGLGNVPRVVRSWLARTFVTAHSDQRGRPL